MSDVQTEKSLIQKLDDAFLISEIFASRKMAAMLALGASAGLPILLVYKVLSAWLTEADVSRSTIGFFVKRVDSFCCSRHVSRDDCDELSESC